MRRTGIAHDFLEEVGTGNADLCITDPPWPIEGGGVFDDATPYDLMDWGDINDDFLAIHAALKPSSHCYVFMPAGEGFLSALENIMANDFRFQRLLVWEKGGAGGLGAYRNVMEPIGVFSKGAPGRYNKGQQPPSILKAERPGLRTAKPWQLYKTFLEMSSDPGDLVIDPYCGTDPLEKACRVLQPPRRWMSNDVRTPKEVEAEFRHMGSTRNGRARERAAKVPGQGTFGNLEAGK